VAKCTRCGSSSFEFTVSSVQCTTCGAVVPRADLQRYSELTEPQGEEITFIVTDEEPIVPISPKLDQKDQLGASFGEW
jgi:phage FluMu protein Com